MTNAETIERIPPADDDWGQGIGAGRLEPLIMAKP